MKGIKPDGEIGQSTWKALKKASAQPGFGMLFRAITRAHTITLGVIAKTLEGVSQIALDCTAIAKLGAQVRAISIDCASLQRRAYSFNLIDFLHSPI